MYPILVQFGPITIYSLWIFTAIGFFAALLLLLKLLQKDRQKLSFIAEHSLAIFFGGLIVSRLFFVISHYQFFFSEWDISNFLQIFYIWDKGLSFWGGLLGLILTLLYFCFKNHENMSKWLDIISISTLGGLIFGNIGTFLDGRNYGRETSLPWGVIIESSRFAVPIHPVQLYAAIYCLLITIVLYQLYYHKIGKKQGTIALIGIGSYSLLRFLEEFLRGDESNYFLGLREAQIYCIIAFIITGVLLYRSMTSHESKPLLQ